MLFGFGIIVAMSSDYERARKQYLQLEKTIYDSQNDELYHILRQVLRQTHNPFEKLLIIKTVAPELMTLLTDENLEGKASSELVTLAVELTPEVLGIGFDELFATYLEENPEVELTEADLVAEILEAGGYQDESDMADEDVLVVGLIAIAGPLGLI